METSLFGEIRILGNLSDYFRELQKQARRCAKSSTEPNLPAIPTPTYLHDLKPKWEEKNEEYIQKKLQRLVDFIQACRVEEVLAPPPSLAAWAKEHVLPAKPVADAPRLSDDDAQRFHKFMGG
jgi:hypothetical protein